MKKKFALLLICTGSHFLASAQDVIIYKNGNELKVKVLEVAPTEIKYKKFDNVEGPSYSDLKSSIFMIKYENGVKEVFNTDAIPNIATVSPNSAAVVPSVPPTSDEDEFLPEVRKYGGPRMGVTFVDRGVYRDALIAEGKNDIYSQFGWQFEKRLFTTKTGISAMVEFVPLIGGIDMGKFIPSLTGLIGIRIKNGLELGAGPNLAVYGYRDARGELNTSTNVGIVIAAGMSFKSDKIYFPVNIAFVPSVGKRTSYLDPTTNTMVSKKYETGAKISILVGFNYRKH